VGRAHPQGAGLWSAGFVLIAAASFSVWFCIYAIATLLPLSMKDAGFSEGSIGLAFGASAIASLFGRAFSGWAIDRWGARPFLACGAASLAATAPLLPLASEPALVMAYRIVQGIGIGLFSTAAIGYVVRIAAPAQRGTAIAWLGAVNPSAVAVSPVLAVAILNVWGAGAAFGIAGAAALAALVGGLCVPPTRAPEEGTAVTLYTRSAIGPGLVGGTVGLAFGAFVAFAPLIARERGFSNAGVYLLAFAIGTIASRIAAGPVSDRWGRAIIIGPGLAAAAITLALVGVVRAPSVALLMPLLYGIGHGFASTGLIAWTLDIAHERERATASSTFYAIMELGVFAGAAAMGVLVEHVGYAGLGAAGAALAAGAAAHARMTRAFGAVAEPSRPAVRHDETPRMAAPKHTERRS
jgi:MFS family permease